MSIFKKVKGLRPRKRRFPLTHDNKLSHDMGVIVPCFVWNDLLPGSKARCSVNQLTRMQALLSPIMHNVDTYVQFWKVPYRLLDPAWTRFISGEGEVNTDFVYDPPYFTYYGLATYAASQLDSYTNYLFSGSLLDFLGYPAYDTITTPPTASRMPKIQLTIRPLQAYCMILKNWYINENISNSNLDNLLTYIDVLCPDAYTIDSRGFPTGDLSIAVYNLLKALRVLSPSMCFPHAWSKDYFTSALPFVQVGDPVQLSLANDAPVTSTIPGGSTAATGTNFHFGNSTYPIDFDLKPDDPTPGAIVTEPAIDGSHARLVTSGGSTLTSRTDLLTQSINIEGTADLSEASAITVLELRIANALQSFKELTARIGHRYIEYLKGTWNVSSRDARLQLPEWIGGGKCPINIADVEQTAPQISGSTPLASLGGKGTGMAGGFAGFKTYIEEDCLIIGLMFTQPKGGAYCQQGFNRHLTKLRDRFDFFHPKFEHIGEQAIRKHELLYTGSGTFGYSPRYAEYKYWANETHGQFNTSLDYWHYARKFDDVPTLSPEFIYMQQSEMTRPFAIQSVQQGSVAPIQTWLHFDVEYFAPMSKYGTPMLLN